MRRLNRVYGDQIIQFEDGHLAGAHGAALLAKEEVPAKQFEMSEPENLKANKWAFATRPPLKLKLSHYPCWDVEECYIDKYQNEIRVTQIPRTQIVQCYLGVDIGSTSTKLAVIDQNGEIICDVYRKTDGDPIGATQKLFSALLNINRRKCFKFDVYGCAITGSGRKMVGMVIGTDRIINEITCHVEGAMHVDPEIDTIFEIGGQDSKYMRIHNGRIIDAAMNCQYALKDRMILNELGYTDIPILSPTTHNSYQGLPEKLRRRVWKYVIASDILMKLRCKKRPYASDQSLVLKIFKDEVTHLADAIESCKHFERVFEQSLKRLGSIEQSEDPKPLVGIVGEIYVRCNAFANQDVIESIERYG